MLPHLSLEVPPVSARVSAAVISRLIASGNATTKADLAGSTGLARTTVDTGLRTLFELENNEFCAQFHRLTPPFSSAMFQYMYADAPLVNDSRMRSHGRRVRRQSIRQSPHSCSV